MNDHQKKTYYLKNNIFYCYLAVLLVFSLDLITPLGFAVWILYIIPVLLIPYKSADKRDIIYITAVITFLLWLCFLLDDPGGIPHHVAVLNRLIITKIVWIIAYVQIQRIKALRELTGKIRVEETLAREREVFESIFNSIPVMIVMFDSIMNKFAFNQAFITITGWTDEDTSDGRIMEKVYPDPVERERGAAFMQSLQSEWREFILTAKDGSLIESSWFNIWLEKGMRIGIGIDLRMIKSTERRLRENQAILEEAQRLAGIGSFTVNYMENNRVEWSEELYRLYEWDEDRKPASIEQMYDMIHPEDRQMVRDLIVKVKEEKIKADAYYRVVLQDNTTKYVHGIFKPSYDLSGRLTRLFGTIHDVTGSLRQQEIINETMQRLERSNKDLEQFAYAASHDLQEPLRMVSSYLDLLSRRYKDKLDDKAEEFIGFAVDGARRMHELINDLLIFSRVSSRGKDFTHVDMNKVLNDVLQDLSVLIKEKGAVISSASLPDIIADPIQMRQLLLNLTGNALKFHNLKNPEIIINARAQKSGWLFSVKDNGIGISKENYERIFSIFQRLHSRDEYPGTGIGLALCKKIVERHNGKIWLESEEGKGTTFYFIIPFLIASENPGHGNVTGEDEGA